MKEISEKSIVNKLKEIADLEEAVREYINTTRYQTDLLQDLDICNQICSSLDTLGDISCTLQDYLESDYPSSTGLQYIFTYGILQALFIQQDAMSHLSEAFEVEFQLTDKLREVRGIRNASIGHPTKNKVKGKTYFNYISRTTLSKEGFTLLRSFDQGKDEFKDIDLIGIIEEQLTEIIASYKQVANKLSEADKMHKEKYKDKLLIDIFHSSLGYLFGKVSEGISSPRYGNRDFGLSMLKSIEGMYLEFEKELKERDELNDYLKYDLDEYKHAISRLESFFTEEDSNITESDARIYTFYIREQHQHFVSIANEVDEEYKIEV
jgi:hypothetical protein